MAAVPPPADPPAVPPEPGASSVPVARLQLRNDLAELRPMSEWLDAELRALGVADDWRFNFDLCANEAVANTIGYGYPQGGPGTVELRLYREGDAVTLEIEDDAVAYDPLARPPHVRPPSLEAAAIGGLGVDLIRTTMRACSYARRDGRNLLRMTGART